MYKEKVEKRLFLCMCDPIGNTNWYKINEYKNNVTAIIYIQKQIRGF